jgi:hypothetical protein
LVSAGDDGGVGDADADLEGGFLSGDVLDAGDEVGGGGAEGHVLGGAGARLGGEAGGEDASLEGGALRCGEAGGGDNFAEGVGVGGEAEGGIKVLLVVAGLDDLGVGEGADLERLKGVKLHLVERCGAFLWLSNRDASCPIHR